MDNFSQAEILVPSLPNKIIDCGLLSFSCTPQRQYEEPLCSETFLTPPVASSCQDECAAIQCCGTQVHLHSNQFFGNVFIIANARCFHVLSHKIDGIKLYKRRRSDRVKNLVSATLVMGDDISYDLQLFQGLPAAIPSLQKLCPYFTQFPFLNF